MLASGFWRALSRWREACVGSAGIVLAMMMAGAASAQVTPGTPLTLGQFCTAAFGSATDPSCETDGLVAFQAQCTAAGMQFVPGVGGNQTRCIVAGGDLTADQLAASNQALRDFLRRHLVRVDIAEANFDAARARYLASVGWGRHLTDIIRARQNDPRSNLSDITGLSSFTAEPIQQADAKDSPWQALAYQNPGAPAFKAPPAAPGPRIAFGAWGMGFGDWERRRGENVAGIDTGRRTSTGGGQGGVHAFIFGLFSPSDGLAIGISGGATRADMRNNGGSTARIDGPGVGIYSAYVNGGLSGVSVFNVDYFDVRTNTAAGADPNMKTRNFSYASEWSYRIALGRGYWIQPTVGFAHAATRWDGVATAIGFQNGHVTSLQGGVRVGTAYQWNGLRVETSISGLAENHVSITGGYVPQIAPGVLPVFATDEGKVFARGIGTLGFHFDRALSGFIEAELRGRSGVFGGGVRGGLRYNLAVTR